MRMSNNLMRQVNLYLFVSFFIPSTIVSSFKTLSNSFNGHRASKISLIQKNGIFSSGSMKQPSSKSTNNKCTRYYCATVSNIYDDFADDFYSDSGGSSSSGSSRIYKNTNEDSYIRNSTRISNNDNNDQILRSNEPSSVIRLFTGMISGKNYFSLVEIDDEFAKELVIMRGRDLAEAMFLSGICL
jgi:hypothetical protein